MNNDTFQELTNHINTSDTEWYSGMELNKLEILVRGQKVVANKIYNYMSKGYIPFDESTGKKRIHRDDVVRYLTKCRQITTSDFDERFADFLT